MDLQRVKKRSCRAEPPEASSDRPRGTSLTRPAKRLDGPRRGFNAARRGKLQPVAGTGGFNSR
jgi:hypothetical protein